MGKVREKFMNKTFTSNNYGDFEVVDYISCGNVTVVFQNSEVNFWKNHMRKDFTKLNLLYILNHIGNQFTILDLFENILNHIGNQFTNLNLLDILFFWRVR